MRRLLIFFLVFWFVGCAATPKEGRIKKGMTKEDVTSIMGQPDETRTKAAYEALLYERKRRPQEDRDVYYVIFKDGKVVKSGAGTVTFKDAEGNIIMLEP